MRRCGECGQVVPIRWRNDGPPPQRQHIAGDVVIHRTTARPGFPWGRVRDRVQNCSRCGELLVRGIWALFFPAGAPVIEHGEKVPVLVEGVSERATPCTAGNDSAEILDLSFHSRKGGRVTPGPTECPICGKEVPWRGGRPATYCSTTCRVRAHRAAEKSAQTATDPAPGIVLERGR
jgi:hypothetical protein